MPTVDGPFALFDDDFGGALLLTGGRPLEFSADIPARHVLAELEATAKQGRWLAIAARYELGGAFDPAATVKATPGRPPLIAWVFDEARTFDQSAVATFLDTCLAALPEEQRLAGVAEMTCAVDRLRYGEQVRQIRRWIADGDCYQINLTFPLTFRVYGHPLSLYAGLRSRQPVRYGGCLITEETTILSFSPELFFERRGDRVRTRPMKGTAPRGATAEEDDRARAGLLLSEKERAENVMIVDLLRNDLGRLAQPGRVRVEALFATEAYPTLWQLVSTVSADLPGVSLAELFAALFPCGSITGAPKLRAMQRVAELEPLPRGLYTGAFGWLAPNGDCRFNVAIRTLEFDGGTQGRLGVGSGIVAEADPAGEYAECILKARFLTGYDPGFALVETLRLEDGVFPRLAGHLHRLRSSADALGFVCDLPAIVAALHRQADSRPQGVFRVRLTLTHAGEHRLLAEPFLPPSDRAWRVVLAQHLLDADNYLLRHKTTARAAYERALAAVAGRPEVFDVIFLNARGEVCEGARSNLFVEREGRLLTPPLSCGLLPGVLRQSLLDAGRASEQVLWPTDLRAGGQVFVGNALRGLLPVEVEG
ncbi:MAG: aminodeoxychorismate synthase component I [Candidatus Accumulibacter sp.]|nr:aminodeoxychorismate synthase component I [Accumulibacter sp.]